MYKLSVPASITLMDENSLPQYVKEFKEAGVDRVFLCLLGDFSDKNSIVYKNPDSLTYLVSYFRENGFEVGLWQNGFGHGVPLAVEIETEMMTEFTPIMGVNGEVLDGAFCPLDKNYQKLCYEGVKILAKAKPDMIMFDDDFRLNTRFFDMACCCDLHLQKFYEEIGEVVPREKIEELVYTGGANLYRKAWRKISGESIFDFAKLMRKAVDEVDENIRLGCCTSHDMLDYSGSDVIRLAKIFAGKTRPFFRAIGAPYYGPKIQNVVEYTRMQLEWCKDEDIEIFTEGDVYPRPRYNVPSRYLEIFDLATLATGEATGSFKYMFDYSRDVSYETGYNDRHKRNKWLRDGVCDLFGDKKNVGVRVFEVMHKCENYALPEVFTRNIGNYRGPAHFLENTVTSPGQRLMSENGIPTVYGFSPDYPAVAFGESGRYISKEELVNGAIIDIHSAKLLMQRGIDTGLETFEKCEAEGELFVKENDTISGLTGIETYKVTCSDKAIIKTKFVPFDTAASYYYENSDGIRFYVICIDGYVSDKEQANYWVNYHRQSLLIEAVEWLCGKPLPVTCTKNPYLYIQTAKSEDGKKLSVALYNIFIDEIIEPKIYLDKTYKSVRFLNCNGKLCGDYIQLDTDIEPYGFAAFEVEV